MERPREVEGIVMMRVIKVVSMMVISVRCGEGRGPGVLGCVNGEGVKCATECV